MVEKPALNLRDFGSDFNLSSEFRVQSFVDFGIENWGLYVES
jgi:hypothetical protein